MVLQNRKRPGLFKRFIRNTINTAVISASIYAGAIEARSLARSMNKASGKNPGVQSKVNLNSVRSNNQGSNARTNQQMVVVSKKTEQEIVKKIAEERNSVVSSNKISEVRSLSLAQKFSQLPIEEATKRIFANRKDLRAEFLKNKLSPNQIAANKAKYLPMAGEIGKEVGLNKEQVEIFKKVVLGESDCNPFAVSSTGAMGLCQTTSYVYKGVFYEHHNPFVPEQNLRAGATFFKDLWAKYKGDKSKILMAYKKGEPEVDKAISLSRKGELKHWRDAKWISKDNYPEYILSRKA